ncbi:MAG: hypothetical protein GVY13_15535 [Alphaproteobacteria bacterium]|jgi:hypothetical protein|nr:hypothetical protein [Alphaproteobacteria bacterium]
MPSPNLIRLSRLPVAETLTGLERLPVLRYGIATSARVEQILGSPDNTALDLETPFYEPPTGGRILLRADRTVHLVSAAGGAVEAVLPLAREVPRRVAVIKKLDDSGNPVTVTAEEQTVYLAPRPAAAGGKVALDGTGSDPAPIGTLDPPSVPDPDPTVAGLDGQAHVLAARYDFVMAISNGAEWQIIAGGWQGAQDDHLDLETVAYALASGGVIALVADRSVHLVDAAGGETEAHLPAPADVPTRVMIVKKTDVSANAVTVTTALGGGPDGIALALADPGDNVTVISDGSAWHVWSRDPIDQDTFRHDLTIAADSPTLTLDRTSGDAALAVRDNGAATDHDLVYSYADGAWSIGADIVWHAGNFGLPAVAGFGIAEKTDLGAWAFRGVGTGDPEHLLRLADGDARYQLSADADADLTAIAALTGTGMAERTGADTWALRGVGTADPAHLLRLSDGDARYEMAGAGGLDADLTAIAGLAGYGILEKNSTTEGDWGFRGLGAGAADHLLRRSDGDTRYVNGSEIATVGLTGDYGDLINTPGVASGWSNPSGSGFNRGSFNADDETAVSSTPTQSEVTELSNRLKDTRAVLRALILDLKTIGIFSS